jgi:hypothetical protein
MSAQLLRNDGIEPTHSANGSKAVMLACRVERSFCGKSWGTHVRSPGRGKARGQATNQYDSG